MNKGQFAQLFPQLEDKYDLFAELVNLVHEKSKVVNITAIKEKDQIWEKHIVDSLQPINFLDLSEKTVIDIGTGAGFPGLPLAIAMPEASFVLLDSTLKKINIVKEFANSLGLKNVKAKWGRAEELKNEQYDIVVSRAVGYLPKLLTTLRPFVKKGGQIIVYKSYIEEEIKEGELLLGSLNLKRGDPYEYYLPSDSQSKRILLSYLG